MSVVDSVEDLAVGALVIGVVGALSIGAAIDDLFDL